MAPWHRSRAVQRDRGSRSCAAFAIHSVVVDAALNVGGVQIAEHLEWGWGISLFWVALLKLLQFTDLLLNLAGDSLITIGLSFCKC